MFIIEEDPINPAQKSLNYKEQDTFLSKVLMYELKRFEDFRNGNIYPSSYFKEWETEGAPVATTPTQTAAPVANATPVSQENPFAANAVEEDDNNPF